MTPFTGDNFKGWFLLIFIFLNTNSPAGMSPFLSAVTVPMSSPSSNFELGGLMNIDNCLRTTNEMLSPDYDLNNLDPGIYSFSPESKYPVNFPSVGGRGIVVCLSCYPHIVQIVYSFQLSSVIQRIRLSYNEGG